MSDINRMRKLAGLAPLNESIESIGNNNVDLQAVANKAKQQSLNGYVQHVNKRPDGSYYVDDWYDSDATVCSYMNGKRTDNGIDEELTGSHLDALKNAARKNSEGGYAQYVNKDPESNAGYKLSNHSDETTVCGYKDGNLITGMEESTEFMDGSTVDESAPPGMEDVVMKLKKEYPDDHSKAFATAWAIYNKKHGKNESIEDNEVDEARGKKEAIKAPFHAEEINALVPLSYEEAKPQALKLIANCSASPEKKNFLTRQIENNRKGVQGIVELLYNMLLSFEGNAVIGSRYNKRFSPMREGVFSDILDEIRAEAQKYARLVGPDVAIKIVTAKHDLDPDEQSDLRDELIGQDLGEEVGNQYNTVDEFSSYIQKEVGHKGMMDPESLNDYSRAAWHYFSNSKPESARELLAQYLYDNDVEDDVNDYLVTLADDCLGSDLEEGLNNGYDDRHTADAFGEYPGFGFPSGADSPSTKKTGPSGARQGDNPEQKKMAVTEDIYKEMVYKYRSHLKESKTK